MKPLLSSDMKYRNRQVVYDYIRKQPDQTVSRAEVSRQTKISAPTVLKIFDFLLQRNMLEDLGVADAIQEPGRRPNLLRFRPEAANTIGAFYDGNKLELSVVNLNDTVVCTLDIPTTASIPDLLTQALPNAVAQLLQEIDVPILGLGIALPAIIEKDSGTFRHLVVSSDIPTHGDFATPLAALQAALSLPIYIENDVNAAAVAEYRVQQLGHAQDLICLLLNRGFGAGIILDGKLRQGRHFSCGEIGHMVFDPDYFLQPDTPGYMDARLGSENLPPMLAQADTPQLLSKKTELAAQFAQDIALVIANLANSLDIENFVLGGQGSDVLQPLLIAQIQQRLARLCLHPVNLRPCRCYRPCSSGAASLVIDREVHTLLADSAQ